MREKLIELLKDTRANAGWHHWGYEESADHLIRNGVIIPVRCKDCVFAETCDASDSYVECRQFFGMAMENDWYCAGGERKDEE